MVNGHHFLFSHPQETTVLLQGTLNRPAAVFIDTVICKGAMVTASVKVNE